MNFLGMNWRMANARDALSQCSNFYLDVEKKLADFGSHFSITWYRYMLVWKYFSNLDDKCLKKIKFSNLVHTKVLKMSRFFNFSPFGPNWAKFQLAHVTKHVKIHFLGHSKSLQQAAVKWPPQPGFEPWTLLPKQNKKQKNPKC